MFDILFEKLQYLSLKQNVISSNIANASTPNFTGKRLEQFKQNKIRRKNFLSILTTNNQHISNNSREINRKFKVHNSSDTPKINGNNINLESEMMSLYENSVEHQKAASIYSKMSGMIKFIANNK